MFAQEQLQRFEKRFEDESQPDEEYKRWVDLYHPSQSSRKIPVQSTDTMVAVSMPNNVLQKQLLETASASSTSLPKVKPKAATYGRVLTSTENLKIIEEQEKERELKKKQKHKGKKSPNKNIPIPAKTTMNLSGLDYNALVHL